MPSTPEAAISAFEALAGVLVTVHDLAGHLRGRVDPERLSHRHPVCRAAKHRAAGRCVAFDVEGVANLGVGADAGVVRRCPFQHREALVTEHRDGRLAWALFAGPLPDERAEVVLEGLRQLAARLREWQAAHPTWPTASAVRRGGAGLPDDRRGVIERWVAVHHTETVGLDDLAIVLGLSRSAASRAVRAATGRSLPELLTSARLTTAQALLSETDLPMIDVALRSGFSDRSHFHRCFRSAFGRSPGQWRRLREREA